MLLCLYDRERCRYSRTTTKRLLKAFYGEWFFRFSRRGLAGDGLPSSWAACHHTLLRSIDPLMNGMMQLQRSVTSYSQNGAPTYWHARCPTTCILNRTRTHTHIYILTHTHSLSHTYTYTHTNNIYSHTIIHLHVCVVHYITTITIIATTTYMHARMLTYLCYIFHESRETIF